MSELKAIESATAVIGNVHLVYPKEEADKVIAELKEKHKTEVKELLCQIRNKDNNFNRAFDSEEKEIRRLRRLLWHAIALFCARSCEYFNGIMSHCLMGQDDLYRRCEEKKNKYLHAMYKCRAKTEAYK